MIAGMQRAIISPAQGKRQGEEYRVGNKRCVLYDRECIECGECNLCDLYPTKICDNCGKCIGMDGETAYRAIKVDGIIGEDMDPSEYLDDDML